MTITLIIFNLAFGFLNANSGVEISRPNGQDTIYYLSFLEIIEKDFSKGSRLDTASWLPNERKVIDNLVVKRLGKHYVVIPLPLRCLSGIKLDSISRRDEKIIDVICKQCKLTRPLVTVDATWTYLSERSFRRLQLQHPNDPRSYSYWIIGTWWRVRVDCFLPGEGMVFSTQRNFTQWSNAKPMKKFPGISHKRFFNRPINQLKEFLIEHLQGKK